MAVRLSVVLVQSSRMSGLQSGINAELVFQLMGVAGVDLSIVNSLNPSEIAETDRMMLSALDSDLAVVDWSDLDETLAKLAALGVNGIRSPHQLDRDVPPVPLGNRRVYLVDLRNGHKPDEVVSAMKQLLDQRRVVAVPLMLGGMAKGADVTKKPVPASNAATQVTAEKVDSLPKPASPGPIKLPGANTGQVAAAGLARKPSIDQPSESDLDALVDGLNASDW